MKQKWIYKCRFIYMYIFVYIFPPCFYQAQWERGVHTGLQCKSTLFLKMKYIFCFLAFWFGQPEAFIWTTRWFHDERDRGHLLMYVSAKILPRTDDTLSPMLPSSHHHSMLLMSIVCCEQSWDLSEILYDLRVSGSHYLNTVELGCQQWISVTNLFNAFHSQLQHWKLGKTEIKKNLQDFKTVTSGTH